MSFVILANLFGLPSSLMLNECLRINWIGKILVVRNQVQQEAEPLVLVKSKSIALAREPNQLIWTGRHGDLGSSFWGMALIVASTNLISARIAAGCLAAALLIVLFVAKNWTLRGLCIGFIVFLAIVWVLQEKTTIHILKYVILFIGVMNSLFSVYDIYDDLISRRVNSSDAEKFAEICPCPCNGVFGVGLYWNLGWESYGELYLSFFSVLPYTLDL
ncbi:hypothetical protein Tco_1071466 [Tanacetum coccineum]